MNLIVNTAHAATDIDAAKTFVNKVFVTLVNPVIVLLFAVATAVFIYGTVKFINSTDNPTEREVGKSNMVYGIIGFFIMVSAFGIVRLVANTLGVESTTTSQYIDR